MPARPPTLMPVEGPTRLEYIRLGQGPPILLVQGAAATHRHWGDRLLTELARTFELVAFNHRGIGRSTQVDGAFTAMDLADDAVSLLDELGWEQAFVFGVSLGGLVAQEISLRHPERVARVVLGCTSTGAPEGGRWPSRSRDRGTAIARGNPTATARTMFEWGVKDARRAAPEAWLEYHRAAMSAPVDPRTTVLQADALARHSTTSRLVDIAVPTLVIHGDADRIIDITEGIKVARSIPVARFLVVSAGHFFWLEDPVRTARAVAEFCRDESPDPGRLLVGALHPREAHGGPDEVTAR